MQMAQSDIQARKGEKDTAMAGCPISRAPFA